MIFIIAGARPNFMKIAPLVKELKKESIEFKIVHTGQHYDYRMSEVFFKELEIPTPDIFLNVCFGSHATQTANIMLKFEKRLIKHKPSWIVVVGDVNSTLACALTAKKMNIKIAHIESGLRSGDMSMPEEINRILTDHISDLLFTSENIASWNLDAEGISLDKVHFVGNIMIDNLINNIEKVKYLRLIGYKEYGLVTIHRPENVDNIKDLKEIIYILKQIQKKIPLVFPVHPRTKRMLDKYNMWKKLNNITILEPMGYLNFLWFMKNAKVIITDSGGIQEEASYLRIPVLTIRKNTERPITTIDGTNTLVKRDIYKINNCIEQILQNKYKKGKQIEKWDGKTAERIVKILKKKIY